MKVKKGEVVLSISPNDLPLYKRGGWKLFQERKPEHRRKHYEKLKERLAKEGDK